MSDRILDGLRPHELKQVAAHAAKVDASTSPGGLCSLEAAALALLQAHLILMRDCANALPDPSPTMPGAGVSLGGGDWWHLTRRPRTPLFPSTSLKG